MSLLLMPAPDCFAEATGHADWIPTMHRGDAASFPLADPLQGDNVHGNTPAYTDGSD